MQGGSQLDPTGLSPSAVTALKESWPSFKTDHQPSQCEYGYHIKQLGPTAQNAYGFISSPVPIKLIDPGNRQSREQTVEITNSEKVPILILGTSPS